MRALARGTALLRIAAALGAAGGFALSGAAEEARQPVELELVLAVDVSSSVDDDEYFLQMNGLAQAFRHPDVLAALRASAGGVAVTLVQWSDSSKHAVAVDWMAVRDDADAAAFANAAVRAPRLIVGGQTSISGAIRFAMRELDTSFSSWLAVRAPRPILCKRAVAGTVTIRRAQTYPSSRFQAASYSSTSDQSAAWMPVTKGGSGTVTPQPMA